jgi:hypothetical protein
MAALPSSLKKYQRANPPCAFGIAILMIKALLSKLLGYLRAFSPHPSHPAYTSQLYPQCNLVYWSLPWCFTVLWLTVDCKSLHLDWRNPHFLSEIRALKQSKGICTGYNFRPIYPSYYQLVILEMYIRSSKSSKFSHVLFPRNHTQLLYIISIWRPFLPSSVSPSPCWQVLPQVLKRGNSATSSITMVWCTAEAARPSKLIHSPLSVMGMRGTFLAIIQETAMRASGRYTF